MSVTMVHLDACETTQDAARDRARVAQGRVVAVRADSQRAGLGREGRVWHDPPGAALLLSVARLAAMPLTVLDDLPRFVSDCVLSSIAEQAGSDHVGGLGWKAPNDIVTVPGGAKIGGILVDARTRGEVVEAVVIGVGLNVDGAPFVVPDGRAAASITGATGQAIDLDALAASLAERLAARLESRPT